MKARSKAQQTVLDKLKKGWKLGRDPNTDGSATVWIQDRAFGNVIYVREATFDALVRQELIQEARGGTGRTRYWQFARAR